MKLSLVTASNRVGLSAYARILDVCSFASDDVEVVVRDNSQSEQKKAFLSNIAQKNCRMLFVDHCGAEENMLEALRASTGEYVFFIADDDLCSQRAIDAVVRCISDHAGDSSVGGITGQYALEDDRGLSVFAYLPLDSRSVVERTENFLTSAKVNVLVYSAIKRDIVFDVISFIKKSPFTFSFSDQIFSISYLLCGRFVNINRIIYSYDMYQWQNAERGAAKDMQYYTLAGFDPSIIRLHWLICALEGAKTILNPSLGQAVTLDERQAIARKWFALMHNRVRTSVGRSFPLSDSKFDSEATALRDKWLNMKDVSLDVLLMDICGFMALSSQEASFKYYSYWSSV
jgi:hypothetical protein